MLIRQKKKNLLCDQGLQAARINCRWEIASPSLAAPQTDLIIYEP